MMYTAQNFLDAANNSTDCAMMLTQAAATISELYDEITRLEAEKLKKASVINQYADARLASLPQRNQQNRREVGVVRKGWNRDLANSPDNVAEVLAILDHVSDGGFPMSKSEAHSMAFVIRKHLNPLQARCVNPPKGWRCDRGFEHDGPCAAYEEV
jgi:hypothetical protein